MFIPFPAQASICQHYKETRVSSAESSAPIKPQSTLIFISAEFINKKCFYLKTTSSVMLTDESINVHIVNKREEERRRRNVMENLTVVNLLVSLFSYHHKLVLTFLIYGSWLLFNHSDDVYHRLYSQSLSPERGSEQGSAHVSMCLCVWQGDTVLVDRDRDYSVLLP